MNFYKKILNNVDLTIKAKQAASTICSYINKNIYNIKGSKLKHHKLMDKGHKLNDNTYLEANLFIDDLLSTVYTVSSGIINHASHLNDGKHEMPKEASIMIGIKIKRNDLLRLENNKELEKQIAEHIKEQLAKVSK